MADSKKKTGKADRSKVAGKQKYEVGYLAKKENKSTAQVRAAISKVGNSRPKVVAELRKKK